MIQNIFTYGQTKNSVDIEIGQVIISLPSKPNVKKFPTEESFELRTTKGLIMGRMYNLINRKDFNISKDSLRGYYLKTIKESKDFLNNSPNDITFIKIGNNEGVFYTSSLPSEMKNFSYNIIIIIDKITYNFLYYILGEPEEAEFSKEDFINSIRIKK